MFLAWLHFKNYQWQQSIARALNDRYIFSKILSHCVNNAEK